MTKPVTATFFLIQELAWLHETALRAKLQECRECGFEILIPTVAAEHGRSIGPSRVLPRAEHSSFTSRSRRDGQLVTFHSDMDLFEILFDECARLGMGVFMPTGTLSPKKRGSNLMWPYPPSQWFTPAVERTNAAFIREIAERYGRYASFHGWYLSDEMKWSVAEHASMIRAIAQACRNSKPGAPILISPAPAHVSERNRGITDPAALAKLDVDIIAPMDSGGFTHESIKGWTDETFETIERAHRDTSAACAAASKRYWVNVEMFEYDLPARNPAATHPAPPQRVARQLEIAARYAERIACFQYFSLVDAPESKVPLGGEEAVALYKLIHSRNHGDTWPIKGEQFSCDQQ